VLALLAAAVLPLTACGDDGGSADGQADTTAAEPVTIEHRFGSTTLEAPPERIVSLDNQWTDVLVALDAPLVGAALDPVIEGGRYPWQDVIPASVESIPVNGAIPYEAVAALRPDLIVITWAAPEQADYDRLAAIAPTIPLLGDEEVDAWQDLAAVAGEVLGVGDEAAALVDEADARSAVVRAALPGLEGRTYALANYVPGDAIYVVADPDDGSATFFAQLGLQIDPDLLAIADGSSGRAELSLERVGELDADLLVLLTNGADAADIPGFAGLPAVEDGAIALLDLAAVTGLNTPSPLSIPFSLDAIRPALEAAAT
jgi:iron complex transport system substrate-binding protein